jgi:hypothetical protein
MSLVDVDGNDLTTKKRRRQTSQMKKQTRHGDVLFKLVVDLPEGVGQDEFNHIMVEYFGIGHEAFRQKVRL